MCTDTDILKKLYRTYRGGGRSRNLAGTKKLTKISPMSARVLQLEGHVQHVRITTICNGARVFSIIDFINLVCTSESENYARRIWPHLKSLFEIQALVVVVPIQYKPPVQTRLGPATNLMGLQRLLLVLGDKVKDEFRQVDDNAFTRFMAGDTSRFRV